MDDLSGRNEVLQMQKEEAEFQLANLQEVSV
jgi:hypothetical protein